MVSNSNEVRPHWGEDISCVLQKIFTNKVFIHILWWQGGHRILCPTLEDMGLFPLALNQWKSFILSAKWIKDIVDAVSLCWVALQRLIVSPGEGSFSRSWMEVQSFSVRKQFQWKSHSFNFHKAPAVCFVVAGRRRVLVRRQVRNLGTSQWLYTAVLRRHQSVLWVLVGQLHLQVTQW